MCLLLSPIFIVGVGRSGTTLLQNMLNSHPEISFPPETSFLRRYVFNKKAEKIFNKTGKLGLISVLKRDKDLKRVPLNIEDLINEEILLCNDFSGRKFYLNILFKYLNLEKKKIIGDKDPRLIEYIPSLSKNFPNSFVIQIIRDPRDTILSRMNVEWARTKSFLYHLFVYNFQVKMGLCLGPRYFKKRYIFVKYEDLIKFPEKTLSSLCELINVNYSKKMLKFKKSAEKIVGDDERDWKSEVFGDLKSNNFLKWKGAFSKFQLYLIYFTLNNYLRKFHYNLKPDKSNIIKLICRITAFFINNFSNLFIIYLLLKQNGLFKDK
ncbi:MAG: sulfotransferase family protein [Promethearchaeota archaeon]